LLFLNIKNTLDLWGLKVFKVLKVILANKDPKVIKETQEQQDQKVIKVHQE
jgi:predicted transcriptional regulator